MEGTTPTKYLLSHESTSPPLDIREELRRGIEGSRGVCLGSQISLTSSRNKMLAVNADTQAKEYLGIELLYALSEHSPSCLNRKADRFINLPWTQN